MSARPRLPLAELAAWYRLGYRTRRRKYPEASISPIQETATVEPNRVDARQASQRARVQVIEWRRCKRVGRTTGCHPQIRACVDLARRGIQTLCEVRLGALELDGTEHRDRRRRGYRQRAYASLPRLKLGDREHGCGAVEGALGSVEERHEPVEERRQQAYQRQDKRNDSNETALWVNEEDEDCDEQAQQPDCQSRMDPPAVPRSRRPIALEWLTEDVAQGPQDPCDRGRESRGDGKRHTLPGHDSLIAHGECE